MMFWPRREEAGGFLAGAVGVHLDEGPELVATQTRAFSSADLEGSAAMARRPGDAYAGVAAGDSRLIRAGVASHGR